MSKSTPRHVQNNTPNHLLIYTIKENIHVVIATQTPYNSCMANIKIKDKAEFSHPIDRLKWLMQCLRTPDKGCPWDLEQDYKSIAPHTIEEAYEVVDAIENGTMEDFKNELGDLLLQVIYHSQMASEDNQFTFDDVTNDVTDKMISRHPHVFGDATAQSAENVTEIWDNQKEKENGASDNNSAVANITKGLPALLRAEKIQKKAAKTGFEWQKIDDALLKVQEEIHEFKNTVNHIEKEEEFGDILFALVNLGRMQNLNAEEALRKANEKFIKRFQGMENDATNNNVEFKNLSLTQMIQYWEKQKTKDKN